jgi:hypothetical protein
MRTLGLARRTTKNHVIHFVLLLALFGALLGTDLVASDGGAPSTQGPELTPMSYYKGEGVCRKARRIDKKPGRCARKRVTKLRKKRWKPRAAYLAKYGDARPLDGQGPTLSEAAKASSACCSPPPTYCKGWKQTFRGIYYVNWKEIHVGDFCYNGRDVWVTRHKCDRGYGIGYDIVPKECSKNKIYVNTKPGYGYQNWDVFRVHVAWKGIPIWKTYTMHVNVYPSGNFYGY